MTRTLIALSIVLAGGVLAMTATSAQELPSIKATEFGPVKMTSYDYDMSKVVQKPKLTEPELQGRHLYYLRCAACHTTAPNGYGPRLDQARVKALGEDAIRTKVANGSRRMPGFKHMFDAAQVNLIIGYLKSIPPAKAP